jgi:hypothetical protein
MAQIFHPAANTIAKATIFGALLFLAGAAWVGAEWYRSPYQTYVNVVRDQPVPFSHEHHAGGLGIDCRVCHTSVEDSPFAGLPPTKTCMSCHSQIWTNAQILEPVRQSWAQDRPLVWTRVHDLPDYVYFNHSIHIAKGVGCATCHGPVDEMPLMWKANTLQMEWCLSCHREPEKFLRPREKVFEMRWTASDELKANKEPYTQVELGRKLVKEYAINKDQLTNCSICHR